MSSSQSSSQPSRLSSSPPPGPAGQRYLVTGAPGFIGRHLVRRLTAAGVEVHATTRSAPPSRPGARWWNVELADPAATHRIVAEIQPDVIVHLASRAEGGRKLELVVPMLNDNVLSAVNVMAAAAAVPGCRAVLAGSIEEGAAGREGTRAHSPYAASKIAATAYAALFRNLWELPVTVLRLAMVYGPDEPNRRRLVPYVIDSLLRGVAPELSSGSRRIDWIYIDDVVDALLAATTETEAIGKVMDVGSGSLLSIRDTVTLIADIVGAEVAPAFGRLPDRAMDRDFVTDPGPATRHLGWSPRVDLATGISRTVDWHMSDLSTGPVAGARKAATA